MNDLSEIFSAVSDGDIITLEKNKIYEIAPEDSFHLKNLFFSNTANQEENPEGERFCGIYLEEKNNITIDGNGATIMIHGIMTPFIFKRCRNIVMKNLTIDHFRPTMTEYTVTECRKGSATLKINDEYLYRIDGNMIYWHSENDFSGKPYWEIPYKGPKVLSNALNPETGIVNYMVRGEGESRGGFPDIVHIDVIDKNTLRVELRDKEKLIPEGTVVSTRCIIRFQIGGASDESENILLENIRVKSMNGFGILAQNSRNITYRNLDLTPAEGRTITSDADFFHFSGCSGEIKVVNCKATGAHDDIINIHGTHLKIVSVNRENNTLLMRYSHPESWGFNPYSEGDEIEYVSGNALVPYACARVKNCRKISNTDFEIEVDFIPDIDFAENDVVENVTRTASLYVEGNVFERIPSRAILCTTRKDVVIKNNTFRYMGAPVICVADDANFWFESGRSGNILFEGNTVVDCGAVEAEKGCDVIRYEPVVLDKNSKKAVHERIIIRGNKFINNLSDKYTINLNYVREAEISDNESNVMIIEKADGILGKR